MKIKRIVETLTLVFCIIFSGCGEKKEKITVTGADGTVYESYQDCCANQDFEAAHRYLAKMKNDHSYNIDEAAEFVFKQEALYLMSMNDEIAKKRILYLLKEEEDNEDHVLMLIDLAIDNDDEAFVKTLANRLSVSDGSINVKLMDYLLPKNPEENKAFLASLFRKLTLGENSLLELAMRTDDRELVLQLIDERNGLDWDKILAWAIQNRDDIIIERLATPYLIENNSGLANYLADSKSRKHADLLFSALLDTEESIPNQPQLGIQKNWTHSERDLFCEKCEEYESKVKKHNDKCQQILDLAIKHKNQYLAQRAMGKLRSNISHTLLPDQNNYHCTKVAVDNTQVDIIKKSYQDALRNGAFK